MALWASKLSPFALKVEAMLVAAGIPYRWMPESGEFFEAHALARRLRKVKGGRLPLTWPPMTELDELPLVPFLFAPGGENLYDSSAIAVWLDDHRPAPATHVHPLLPPEPTAERIAIRLIDEALDEIGLYLVHHNRWVVAARDNDAGARLAREMRPLLGPLSSALGSTFPARQVRRLPYLFSVADPADRSFDDLPRRRRPPSRRDFPPTHELIEEAFAGLLAALEPVFASQPFLFGERLTLADASVYGQLGMNRSDPSADAWIRRDAPATAAWLDRIARGEVGHAPSDAELSLGESLSPLLDWIYRTFVPLMQQNQDAYERHRAAGETRFNERAFDAGRALYEGELLGRPFRSVVKTFQVRVWRDLRADWEAVGRGERIRLERLLPQAHGMNATGYGP